MPNWQLTMSLKSREVTEVVGIVKIGPRPPAPCPITPIAKERKNPDGGGQTAQGEEILVRVLPRRLGCGTTRPHDLDAEARYI